MDETPQLRYPSLLRRYVASLIDGAVLAFLFVLYVQHPWRSQQTGAIHYWPLLSLALYEPLLTRYRCTLGQLLMRIRVRTEPKIDRVPVLRTLLRLAVKYSLGIVSFLFLPAHPKKQALHDLAADTIVVNAFDVALRHDIARRSVVTTPDSVAPKSNFSGWLTGSLLLPLPTVICLTLYASLSGQSRNTTLLLGLGLGMLALGAIAFVATAIAITSIARSRALFSARNVAQIVPAALLSFGLIAMLTYTFVSTHAWVHANVR